METKFYRCPMCGNIIVKVADSSVPVVCCGKPMMELTPNTVEASLEKHLPCIMCLDNKTLKVDVGSEPHPMLPEHYIQFLCLETEKSFQIVYLNAGETPCVTFRLDSKPKNVYAYCNIHGLWKTEIKECCM